MYKLLVVAVIDPLSKPQVVFVESIDTQVPDDILILTKKYVFPEEQLSTTLKVYVPAVSPVCEYPVIPRPNTVVPVVGLIRWIV